MPSLGRDSRDSGLPSSLSAMASVFTRQVQTAATPIPDIAPIQDYGPQLNFIIWLLTAFALTILGLRVYCKQARGRGLWWDDHVLIISWVGAVPGSRSLPLVQGRPLTTDRSRWRLRRR